MDLLRWEEGGLPVPERDDLAAEEPLEIRVAGHNVAVTMRTPGHDGELAVGFLVTEGFLHKVSDIRGIRPLVRKSSCNVVQISLRDSAHFDPERLKRNFYVSSSCGLCGRASIEAVHQHFPPVDSDLVVTAGRLLEMPAIVREAQAAFSLSGGLHAAAVFDAEGKLLVLREDVGRHNAVDKAVGRAFLERRFPLDRHILLVSGRASFEIMQKALAARIPIVAAVSAPSSLAAKFAEESGQSLIGFLRDRRMNVYAGAQRVEF